MNGPKFNPINAIDPDAERTTPPEASGSKKPLRRIVAEAILNHADLPEEQAIELRLLMAFDNLMGAIRDGFVPYIEPTLSGDRAEQLLPLRREVLEYIALMEAGLKTFLDAHPMPAEE